MLVCLRLQGAHDDLEDEDAEPGVLDTLRALPTSLQVVIGIVAAGLIILGVYQLSIVDWSSAGSALAGLSVPSTCPRFAHVSLHAPAHAQSPAPHTGVLLILLSLWRIGRMCAARSRTGRLNRRQQMELVRQLMASGALGAGGRTTALLLAAANRDFDERDYQQLLALDENTPTQALQRAEAHEVYRLPVVPFHAAASTATAGPPPACSICLECFDEGEQVRVLPCFHRFHPPCIDRWLLDGKAECPICKTSVRSPAGGEAGEGDEEEGGGGGLGVDAGTVRAVMTDVQGE